VPATETRSPRLHWATELAVLLAVALLIAWPVRVFVAQAFYIPSVSMTPQLKVDDRVIVSKLAYRLHDPRRGDIVVFDAPPGSPPVVDRGAAPIRFLRRIFLPSTQEYIKRVIGLPGDHVQGDHGHVLVNGQRLVEPYLPRGTRTSEFREVVVPRDGLWVMGDNRSDSDDSRDFGPIARSSVLGRAILRVWPVQRASFL
jgi:signal peptidase I